MTRKKVTISFNGGDAVTALGDLKLQIHDASDDSIIASANYAAIGSYNTKGTDGANITYTLNPTGGLGGNGEIVLDGVDIDTADSIKVRRKDAAGNESILSAAVALIGILFEDDFAGATIDTGIWTVVHDNTSRGEFTQNEELIATSKAVGTQSALTSWLMGISGYDIADIGAISFDITKALQAENTYAIGITKEITLSTNDNYVSLAGASSANDIRVRLREAGVNTLFDLETLDISTIKTIKIVIGATEISFWYWNGSAWTQLGTNTALSLTGTVYPFISFDGWSTSSDIMNIDNFVVTDADFDTLRP